MQNDIHILITLSNRKHSRNVLFHAARSQADSGIICMRDNIKRVLQETVTSNIEEEISKHILCLKTCKKNYGIAIVTYSSSKGFMMFELPAELIAKPLALIGLTGLDVANLVHRSIWDAFSNNRRLDCAAVQFKLLNLAHEFPTVKPKVCSIV